MSRHLEPTPRRGDVGSYAAALHAAHAVADHWVQTHPQATSKALPGPQGWAALLAHVATYPATQGVAVAATAVTATWRPDRRGDHARRTRADTGRDDQ